MPNSKPSDEAFGGMTWEQLNNQIINAMGASIMLGAALILVGQKVVGGLLLAVASAIMAATKDNYWIESDVSAIKREKAIRLENFCRDVSLMGVAICFIGGYGHQYFHEAKPQKEAEKED